MSKHKKRNKRKEPYKKRSRLINVPIWICVFYFVVGVLLVSIVPFVIWHIDKPINRDAATPCSATFDSYIVHISPRSGSVSWVELHFTDHKPLDMDGAYFDEVIQENLDLHRGESVQMLLHPNSNDIWEMTSEDTVILAFTDAKNSVLSDNIGICVIVGGCGCFVLIVSAISFVLKWKERKTIQTK
jgi:hypothetical protein